MHTNSPYLLSNWKVEKAKRLAEEEAEKKFLEMAERIKSELQELLLASK